MRRILVTGANKGIGLALTKAILSDHDDTFVYLGSRDRGRGEAARASLVSAEPTWAERVQCIELDVSSDASVQAAAANIADALDAPLYGVVNNAGIGDGSADLHDVLNVNTLGTARVCEAFLPLLEARGGRVVNVTSASGPNFVHDCSAAQQRFFVDDSHSWPQLKAFMDACLAYPDEAAFGAAGLGTGKAYGLSKACGNTYTLLLARLNPDLRINACTPGFIETDMTRPYAESTGRTPESMGMKPPAEGTRSAMFLLFDEPQGNGRFYGSDAQRSPLDRYRAPGSPPFTG